MNGKLFVLSTVAVFLASAQNQPQKDTFAKTLYKQWLNEDVVYIITGEERQAFQRLQSGEPQATIEYQIAEAGTDPPAIAYSEEIAAILASSARQVTLEKLLPLASLEPGQYSLTLRVIDKKRNQTLTRAVGFTVE